MSDPQSTTVIRGQKPRPVIVPSVNERLIIKRYIRYSTPTVSPDAVVPLLSDSVVPPLPDISIFVFFSQCKIEDLKILQNPSR